MKKHQSGNFAVWTLSGTLQHLQPTCSAGIQECIAWPHQHLLFVGRLWARSESSWISPVHCRSLIPEFNSPPLTLPSGRTPPLHPPARGAAGPRSTWCAAGTAAPGEEPAAGREQDSARRPCPRTAPGHAGGPAAAAAAAASHPPHCAGRGCQREAESMLPHCPWGPSSSPGPSRTR